MIIQNLDGDGITELIVPHFYTADLGTDVFIFRNNDDVIERGVCKLWEGKTPFDSDMDYNDETGQISFVTKKDRVYTPVTIEDYVFEEYIPNVVDLQKYPLDEYLNADADQDDAAEDVGFA